MRKLIFSLALVAAGCGGNTGGGVDQGAAAGDLSTGGNADLGPGADLARTAMTFRYVSDHIALPQSQNDYAADLNGSGKKNKLGVIVSLLATQKVDLQAQEDIAFAKGQGLFLFALSSGDATLMTDASATASAWSAVTKDKPDFSGGGTFTVDPSAMKASFDGPLFKGAFQSADPKTLAMPPTLRLNVVLSPTNQIGLPVVGARLAFSAATDKLAMGQINGAIKKTDVDAALVPALAKLFNDIAHHMPCAADCMQVKSTFDVGGCTNPDGTKAKVDGTVDVCEIANNGLVQVLLTPDVQLFDKSGSWKPDKSNAAPDCLSLGVGFTAVKASFAE